MERHFDEGLKELNKQLLRMSALVEEAIRRSVKALVERKDDLAGEVIKSDETINKYSSKGFSVFYYKP